MTLVVIILAVTGALTLLSVVMYMVLAKKNSTDTYSEMGKWVGKSSMKRFRARMYQRSYIMLMRIPGIKKYVWKLRRRLEAINSYDEYTLRREAAKLSLLSMGITAVFVAVLLLIHQSFFYFLWVMLGALVLHNMLMDIFVNRISTRLLYQEVELFSDTRHHYQEHKMVDEALYDATQTAEYEISLHSTKIHDVLTSENPEEELDKYFDVAPDRYTKIFSSISRLIMEYGDKIVRQGSLYLHALAKLGQEINLELLRREKLGWQLRGLVVITLVPLLFIQPIETWAITYFPQVTGFYQGKMGFITKVLVFAVAAMSYMLMRKLQEHDDKRDAGQKKKHIWKKVYETRIGTSIIGRFVPRRSSKKYQRITQLLKDTDTSLTPEWFHTKRMFISFMCVVVTVAIFVGVHITARHNILYTPTKVDLTMGQPSVSDTQVSQHLTDIDRVSVKKLHGATLTKEELIRSVQIEHPNMTESETILAADRLEKKLAAYNNEYFKWWELLIAMLVGVLGYFGPHWVLLFYRRIRQMEMQTEVDQLHTILSILSKFDRMSVFFMLENMERFAVLFKEPLRRCLMNYDSGAEEALRALKEDVSFVPFQRIVERLILSVERIPVEEAFDDLDMEMEYYREKKKQNSDRVIEQKSGWGFMIGFAPIYVLIFLYLVFPLIYSSIEQMTAYTQQLQQFK